MYRVILNSFSVCAVASVFQKAGIAMVITTVEIVRMSPIAPLHRVPILSFSAVMVNASQAAGDVMVLVTVQVALTSFIVVRCFWKSSFFSQIILFDKKFLAGSTGSQNITRKVSISNQKFYCLCEP